MCFLSPTKVFRVTTLQVGHTASPRSWMARCHCSSGPPVGQGRGLRGWRGLRDTLDAKRRTQDPCSAAHPRGLGPAPPSRPGLGPTTQETPPGARWAVGAGTSLLTVLAGAGTFFRTSSGLGPSCFLARQLRDLSSALTRPVHTSGAGSCGPGAQACRSRAPSHQRPAGQDLTFESEGS